MSYDIEVWDPRDHDMTTEVFLNNMLAFAWEIRLLDKDSVIITDLAHAEALLAWDATYEPTTIFEERYRPGVRYADSDVPDSEANFLIFCYMDIAVESIADWSEEELNETFGVEHLPSFLPRLTDNKVRRYYFTGSAHPYRVFLMYDLAKVIAWTLDGIFYDPQEGKSSIITDLSATEASPIERFNALIQS
ncbi:MAG: hypothetical protein BWY76_00339 [bacterium ADurb.Bin429]|nr:MAG: hypothetical protein BWY76_00339 [bacterium ADurb.Bin429]